MKVTAILKGTPDDMNRYRVYIRVNEGEKRTYRATKIKVEKSKFKNGKVVDHPHGREYNEKIRQAILETELGAIKGEKDYPDSDYRAYMNLLLRRWDKEKEGPTLEQFQRENEKFLAWLGDIKLSRVTTTHLIDFKAWANNKYDGSNTVWKIFKNVRTLFMQALDENIIKDDPFKGFDMPKYKDPQKQYLTQEEVDRIEDYVFKHCPSTLKPYATWFLLGCYTGLRFSDMQQFDRKQHIKGGRLTLYTTKTGEIVSIPFKDKIKKLLELIDYQPMQRSNQKFNENLKILQNACDIELPLTVHVSRHTFAVRCANAGIPIEVTAKLMAQTNTKSTAIYYKITNPKIDQEFDKLF